MFRNHEVRDGKQVGLPTSFELAGLKAKFDLKPWHKAKDHHDAQPLIFAARHSLKTHK